MKIIAICLVMMSVFFTNLTAQEEIVNDTIILLTHIEKGKTKFIKDGKKIKYWLVQDGSKNKGRVEAILDSSIIIDGVEYSFDSLSHIRAKSTGLKIIQTSGKVILATGTAITSLGAYSIFYAYAFTDPSLSELDEACSDVILIVFGVLIAAVGVPTMIVGAIPLFLTGKKFDLEKWDMQMQIVPDKKATRKLERQKKKATKEALAQPVF